MDRVTSRVLLVAWGLLVIALLVECSPGSEKTVSTTKHAEAIVKRPISALGGKEALQRLSRLYTRTKAKIGSTNAELEQWTDDDKQCKQILTVEAGGQTARIIRVTKDGKGWERINDGDLRERTEEELAGTAESAIQELARRLYPVFELDQISLSFRGESELEGNRLECVRVTAGEILALDLFFDKKTDLLKKCSHTPRTGGLGGKKVEHFFDGYREFDGVKYAVKSRVRVDGRPFVEDEVLELRFVKEFP